MRYTYFGFIGVFLLLDGSQLLAAATDDGHPDELVSNNIPYGGRITFSVPPFAQAHRHNSGQTEASRQITLPGTI